MKAAGDVDRQGTVFSRTLDGAARLPGIRINRAAFLRSAFRSSCTHEQIERAIETSPAQAGVSLAVIERAAKVSIKYETSKVTALSALAGVPGGFAVMGTAPADLVQYMGHMLRISQKLAYLYSWPDLFGDDEELDEATEGILTLFVGVMFGVHLAQAGVAKASTLIAAQVVQKLPQKALTQGVLYPIVKKVAARLGAEMTKQIFAKGVSKIVPLVGAAVSGGLTLASFFPMCRRLEKHLASLELTKPGHRPGPDADDGAAAAPS